MDNKSYEELIAHIISFCKDNNIGTENMSSFIKKCCLDVLERMTDSNSDFSVLKKDCRVEAFDSSKLYNSIANASDEIGEPLNSSDIKSVISKVQKQLETSKKRIVSSLAIRQAVLDALMYFGHKGVYNNFKNFSA